MLTNDMLQLRTDPGLMRASSSGMIVDMADFEIDLVDGGMSQDMKTGLTILAIGVGIGLAGGLVIGAGAVGLALLATS